MISLLSIVIWVVGFSFITVSMPCHSLLAWRVSTEISAVILIGIPLCVICCFFLTAFKICSVFFIFVNLINICLGAFCLGFILFGTRWVSWTWVAIFFLILGKFSTIISSSIFTWPFFLSYSSGTPVTKCWGVWCCPKGLWGCPHFLSFFFLFFLSAWFISTILSSTSLTPFSASVILLLVPSRVFFYLIYCIVHYILTLFYFF